MIIKNTLKQCYNIAQVLAQVLANKLFTFFQSQIIIKNNIILMCQNFFNFITFVIEYNRINSKFFFIDIYRLDAKNSASASASASTLTTHIQKTKRKNFQTKWRLNLV
jgi:hypothetical protein